jgi:hypothetical protein
MATATAEMVRITMAMIALFIRSRLIRISLHSGQMSTIRKYDLNLRLKFEPV